MTEDRAQAYGRDVYGLPIVMHYEVMNEHPVDRDFSRSR